MFQKHRREGKREGQDTESGIQNIESVDDRRDGGLAGAF
jgi:hypothetical protein